MESTNSEKLIFSYFLNEGKTYCLDQQVISGKENYFTGQARRERINRKLFGKYGNLEIYDTITHTYMNTVPHFLEGSSSICQEPVQRQHSSLQEKTLCTARYMGYYTYYLRICIILVKSSNGIILFVKCPPEQMTNL